MSERARFSIVAARSAAVFPGDFLTLPICSRAQRKWEGKAPTSLGEIESKRALLFGDRTHGRGDPPRAGRNGRAKREPTPIRMRVGCCGAPHHPPPPFRPRRMRGFPIIRRPPPTRSAEGIPPPRPITHPNSPRMPRVPMGGQAF